MRLNLACGTDLRDGWANLDVVQKWPVASRACDVVWDARTDVIPFRDDSAEEVYAGYLLLHLSPRYHDPVLQEIRRVLSPGGVLVVGEVDMEVVMRRFLETPGDERLSELIWGEQGNFHGDDLAEFDKHRQGFTRSSLVSLLTKNGFTGFNDVRIHHPDVFYEMTISCSKVTPETA